MVSQQTLIESFKALAAAITAQENADTLVQVIEGQKPRQLAHGTRFDYNQLVEVQDWDDKLAAAKLTQAETEVALTEATRSVLESLPPSVANKLQVDNAPVIVGEGSTFFGLYLKEYKLAVLPGQNEHAIYSSILAYKERSSYGGLSGLQSGLQSIYR